VRFEGIPRPAVWNDVLVRRAKAGTLLNLDSINLGFIRPKNQDEWALAYCQAELYAEFMVTRYGEDSLVKLLRAYADKWEKSLASVYLQTGEQRKLRDSLRRLAGFDHDSWVFRKKLLELAIEAENFEDAIRWGTEAL